MLASACGSVSNIDNAQRDPSSGAIVQRGDVGTQRLRVGDCFLDTGTGSTQVVIGVPCSHPHDSQVVALTDVPGGDGEEWPGEAGLAGRSRALCLRAATASVGGNLTDPTVGLSAYLPDRQSWDAGDRRVVCTIGHIDGTDMTGSLLGNYT